MAVFGIRELLQEQYNHDVYSSLEFKSDTCISGYMRVNHRIYKIHIVWKSIRDLLSVAYDN